MGSTLFRRCDVSPWGRRGRPTSTPPAATSRQAPGPFAAWTPIAGDVVLLGALVNLGYATVVIYALANPASRIGGWVAAWVQLARKGLAPAYLLAGHADCDGSRVGTFVARAWDYDVHLVAINLIVAAALFAASRRYWPAWSQQVLDSPTWRDMSEGARQQETDVGFGTVMWGAIAVVWWLILENDLFDSAAHCSSVRPWMLWRAPLLATSAHGLTSLAAALWAGRTPDPPE